MVVLGAAMSAGTALAQVPSIISYQGVDPSNPNATIPVKTTLYDAASGGSSVWTEQQNATTDNTGMFSILMGSTGTATPTPLSEVNWNRPLWLELEIGGTTISPRTELSTSPYAFGAAEAFGIAAATVVPDDIDANGDTPADGEVLAFDATTGTFKWVPMSGGGGGSLNQVVAGPGVQVTNGSGPVVTVAIANQGITSGMIANGTINTQHIAPGAVASAQIAANAVITQHIGPQQVTLPKINSVGASAGQAIMFNGTQLIYGNPSPGGPAGGDLTGTYPNPEIAPDAVGSVEIINESILSEDILNETILAEDIAAGAVGTSEILNETILAEDIATGAVTTDEILDETIQKVDIGNDAVGTEEIVNESILSEDIQDATILTDDMAPGNPWTVLGTDGFGNVEWDSIQTEAIRDFTILNEDIADAAINSRTIENETILSEDILDRTITNDDLADGAVDSRVILNETIMSEDIQDGQVMNPDLATNAVDSRVINNESIMSEDIQDGQVMSVDIQDGGVNTIDLADGSVTTAKIADLAVTTAKLDNEAVTEAKIADNAVTSDKILNATILEEDIAPSGPGDTYLQSDGVTVFWGPPAFGSIPPSAITAGPPNTALITDGAGVVGWQEVYSAVIQDLTVATADLAPDAVTTGKVLDGTLLPADIAPSPVPLVRQQLTSDGVTVFWDDDGLTLPFTEIDPTTGLTSFEIIKTGASLGAIRGVVQNAANGSPAVEGVTDGSGAGVRGEATGAGNGGEFDATGTGNAVVADATGTGSALVATATGAAPTIDAQSTGNGTAVSAIANGTGFAVEGTQAGGAGGAAAFSTTDVTNASEVVTVTSAGPIPVGNAALHVSSTNALATGWAGIFESAGTGNGVMIETDDAGDAMALHLERGGAKLSYRVATTPTYTVQPDDIVVIVPDNAAAGTNSVTLPLIGDDGQIVWIFNGDNTTALVPAGPIAGGIAVNISVNRGMAFVYSAAEGGWMPASNL